MDFAYLNPSFLRFLPNILNINNTNNSPLKHIINKIVGGIA
jgi:hypothetical protein